MCCQKLGCRGMLLYRDFQRFHVTKPTCSVAGSFRSTADVSSDQARSPRLAPFALQSAGVPTSGCHLPCVIRLPCVVRLACVCLCTNSHDRALYCSASCLQPSSAAARDVHGMFEPYAGQPHCSERPARPRVLNSEITTTNTRFVATLTQVCSLAASLLYQPGE